VESSARKVLVSSRARMPSIPKQDPKLMRSGRMQVALKSSRNTIPRRYFP
jgi:hypothetical protein